MQTTQLIDIPVDADAPGASVLADVNPSDVTIVHFGVDDGDCTLIIVKDVLVSDRDKAEIPHTISTLIDTGPSNRLALDLWREIWKRIRAEGGDKLDYFVISHLESDHMGCAAALLRTLSLLRSQAEKEYAWLDKMRIVDRLSFDGTEKEPYQYWAVEPRAETPIYETNSLVAAYRATVYEEGYRKQKVLVRVGDDLFNRFEFADCKPKNAQMLCIASNGVIGQKREAQSKERGPLKGRHTPRNENDLSFAFLLRFGSFVYYTGGDLGGEDVTSGGAVAQSNMETPLTEYVNGSFANETGVKAKPFHACALKVNHHGSQYSTNVEFVKTFNPDIAVFSTGLKPAKKIPSNDAIDRLAERAKPKRRQLFTFRIRFPNTLGANVTQDGDPRSIFYEFLAALSPNDIIFQNVILRVTVGKGGDGIALSKAPTIRMLRLERRKESMVPLGGPNAQDIEYGPPEIECSAHGTEVTP